MATTKTPQTPTITDISTLTPPSDLAALRAQKKALDAQIKAAQAAQPQADSLAAEIAKQTTHPSRALVLTLAHYLAQRQKRGQPTAAAQADLLALCARLLDATPTEQADDSD